jgi:ABC-type polysaccharide/polyol phosphate export permease
MGDESFGIWTPENYIIFILTGVSIVIILGFIASFGKNLLREKYWKTLHGLFMSPINIYTFLFIKLFSELLIYGIPLTIIFCFCFLIIDASLITILAMVVFYLMACVFVASIGLAIGSFRMSVEGDYNTAIITIKFFLIFSCYKYPREFYPTFLDFLIVYNPFYYFFDLVRVVLVKGIENVAFNPRYYNHFMIVILSTILAPILSVLLFRFIYKKYGITGY